MSAVFKKELRSMVTNLIAPLMCGVILAVLFLYFSFNNLIAWSADLGVPMNATASLALTFAVPFLTMRLFAEERSRKTEQLYLTAAVTPAEIVLGKFFAVAAVLAFPTVIACMLPFILRPYGEVQYLTSYTAILGFYLYALMITAIGMFVSSLTQNTFGAGIVTFLLLLLGVMMANTYDAVTQPFLQSLLRGFFDFGTRIARMTGGLFDLTSVVCFVSVCLLFLFLTVQVLYGRRYDFHGEGRRECLLILVSCGLAFVLCVLLNLIAANLPSRLRSIDVTSNGLYSITAPSKEIVHALQDEIKIYFLADENGQDKDENIERILQCYAEESAHITIEYVNPVLQPYFYAAYTDTALSADSVVIVNENTGRFQALEYRDLVETQLNMQSFTEYVTGYDAEGQITNALQRVSVPEGEGAKAYTVTAHGERSFDAPFAERFARTGLELTELALVQTEEIPADCALLVLHAPTADYTSSETEKVLSYLERGGNLLVITDARNLTPLPQFSRILEWYGVQTEAGVVCETDPEGYVFDTAGAMPFYLLPLMVEDEVTESILSARNGTVFCPVAGSLLYEEGSADTLYAPLLVTSEEAFLADPSKETVTEAAAGEKRRMTLALRAEKESADAASSRAVIYTSAEMFTKEADTEIALGRNSILFGNTLNALLPEELQAVTIPAKSFYNTLTMSANASRAFMIILGLFVPFLWVMGFALWWMRRRL